MTKRRLHAEPRKPWTREEDDLMRCEYSNTPTAQLAARLPGRSMPSVYQRARVLGLSKCPEFLASPASGRLVDGTRGARTRFQPGQSSWNRGMSYRPGGAAAESQFKAGHRPHNSVPVGTRARTTGGRYWKEKVAEPNVWRFVHRAVWEAANGPVPHGKALVFKDGNRDNCALENLELVDRASLMRRNSLHNYPAPIPQLIQLRGALVRQINRRARPLAGEHEEQA